MTFAKLLRFEIGYHLRRRSTWLYFLIVTGITLRIATESFLANARIDGELFNSPFVIAAVSVIGSMFGLLIAAALAGDAATRDVQTRMESLLFTTPVRKSTYLGARFLGAFVVTALLVAAVPLGFLVATQLPGIEPELLGPFRPAAYLGSYLLFTLHNVFVATAVLFSLAALSRRAIASYAGAAFMFLLPWFCNEFLAKLKGQWALAKILDPLAFTVISALSRTMTSLQKDTQLIGLDGSVLANRLLWLVIGIGALALTHFRFRFAHHTSRSRRARTVPPDRRTRVILSGAKDPLRTRADASNQKILRFAQDDSARSFGSVTRARQAFFIAGRSFQEIVTGWGALAFVALAALLLFGGPELMEHIGVPLFPTTAYVISRIAATEDVTGFIGTFLIVFCAGELIWRERDSRVNEVSDAAPVPDSIAFFGKFLGLSFVIAALQALIMAGGMLTQARMGYYDFEISVYLQLLGIQFFDYLLFALLALSVQVIVNQKYVAHLIVLSAFGAMTFASAVGIEHNMLVYGSDPGFEYSDMSGFGRDLAPLLWFKLYWSGWALVLAVAARLLWVRGRDHGMRSRLRKARGRVTGLTSLGFATGAGLVLVAGGFIFYNTNVLNAYRPADAWDARRAEYERRYGGHDGLPQPSLTGTSLRIELYPERGEAGIRGVYQLENRHSMAIETIHVVTARSLTTESVEIDRPFRTSLLDDGFGYRIYELEEPLKPGESLQLSFSVRAVQRGFTNSAVSAVIAHNGTHFENDLLPAIGYQSDRELSGAGDRRHHGLPPRPEMPPLEDAAARRDTRRGERITFEAIVGTSIDQTAVAPGRLKHSWVEDGRRYFHYTTDSPIRNGYAIFSARYGTQRARWRNVEIEVLHHPGHAWNVDGMVKSIQSSLDNFSEAFGPYPYSQIRLVEAPGAGIGLRAHPINVRYYEGFSLMNPEADHREIDFPFAVVAHEVAHQWWGNQLSPAYVEGAPVLSESLAWYSAIGVIEKTFGRAHLERFLNVMRDAYLAPRSMVGVPLLRAGNWFDAYRKGPFAMYALREYVGEDAVNLGLRRLLETFGSEATVLPTSLDLYKELQAVTPEDMHYLLVDLFEVNTYWNLETREVSVDRTNNGLWQVTLEVAANKFAVDEEGVQTDRQMDDLIEIGVFGRKGPLYLQKHRIQTGVQRITVEVSNEPLRAGIDPRSLLVDTEWRDNVMDVETPPEMSGRNELTANDRASS